MRFLTILLLSFLFSLAFWLISPSDSKQLSYTSPLPEFLSLDKNEQVRMLDIWQPLIEIIHGSESQSPIVSAKAVLLYDLATNKTLYEKNPSERMPMASLTKIMTAIVALENSRPDDRYIVRAEHLVGEDSMGLEAGEILTLYELLYGLMLNSGNDASEVLAGNYPAGREAFLEAMNSKAQALGLENTHFSNPSGLQGDGVQYTTTHDLLVITRYAITQFPQLVDITATFEHILPATATHKEYFLRNETNLISTYPGVKGFKTGYTPEAGMCLVTLWKNDEHKIVGIILNSENRREEMKELLDYSLKKLGITPPSHN